MDDVPCRLLEAIGTANERMIALAVTMRRHPGVKLVHHALDCRASKESGQITLNIAVDAELAHGPGIVCDLDGWWVPDWGIAASIRFVRGEDAEDVRRFPAHRSPDATGFIADLEATVDALVAEAERLDIADFLSRWPGR
jgi:hypothetical protein